MNLRVVKRLSLKLGSILAGALAIGVYMFLIFWFYSALAVSPIVGLVDWAGGFRFALETLGIG